MERMDRITKFYYADHSGNPVGPLTLGEIRKFSDAGVIPRNLMVCEAGGDHWRSFDSIIEERPDRGEDDTAYAETQLPSTTVRNLKIAFTATAAVSLLAFVLNTFADRAAVQSDDPYASSGVDQLVTIFSLLSVAATVTLIYFLAASLPGRHQFTTPLKAAGFFLIPVFSIYWVFRLFSGLVDSICRWWMETAPDKPRRLVWLVPFAVITAVLWAGNEVLGFFSLFLFWGNSPPENWKVLLFFSGLLYAFSEAAFFQFTLSIIHIMRGLIDPGDYAREERRAKQTPFWKFRRRPWNPEGYAWLFPVVFFAIWLARVPQ